MNRRAMAAVIRRDLRLALRTKMVLLPMIILPVILLVLLPGGFALVVAFAADSVEGEFGDLANVINAAPPAIASALSAMPAAEAVLTLVLGYIFAPLYLIIPLMVASVIAGDSFVGERERETLEPLLHSPITDTELVLSKMAAGWLAGVGVAWASFLLYAAMANLTGWPVMGRLWFPNALWIVLAVWVAPGVSAVGLASVVLVSLRVKSTQEAYQLAGIVVLPLVLLVVGQASGVFVLSPWLAALLGLFSWVIAGVVLWLGVRWFDRDRLVARL